MEVMLMTVPEKWGVFDVDLSRSERKAVVMK